MGIREKASIPLSGEHGRISHTSWWRECGGPLSRLACDMTSLGALPVFIVKEVLAFCSNFARILLAFCSNFAPAKHRRCSGSTRSFVQNLGGGRKRSTDVLRQSKVQPISLTVERNFERHFATILWHDCFFLLEFCSNFAWIFPGVARFLTSCSIFNVRDSIFTS